MTTYNAITSGALIATSFEPVVAMFYTLMEMYIVESK